MQEKDKNDLEEFMNLHREEFDMHEPTAGLWDNISKRKKELDDELEVENKNISSTQPVTESPSTGNVIQFPHWIGRVAAAVVISLSSILVYEQFRSKENIKITANNASEKQVAEESTSNISDFEEAEQFYQVKVQEQLQKIQQVGYHDQGLQHEIEYDFTELDSAYVDLRRDLKEEMANEEIIEAMIQTYRLKLIILEEVLQELEKSSKKEEENEVLDI